MKKWKILILVLVGLLLASLIAVLLVPKDNAEKAGMISVCSNITKEKMKSPSSYIIDKSAVIVRYADEAETNSKLTETAMERLRPYIEDGRMKYKIAEVYIDYEAKNSFGVLIKNSAACYYDIISSSSSNSYEMTRANISGNDFMGTDLYIMLAADDGKIGRGGFMQKFGYIKNVVTGVM